MPDLLPLPSVAADPPTRKRRRLSPLVVDARRLARLLCCGVRTIRTHNAAGRLPPPLPFPPPRRRGGRVVRGVGQRRAGVAAGARDGETGDAICPPGI